MSHFDLLFCALHFVGDRDGGMAVSLFRRLAEAHPAAVINLQHQYRMHRSAYLLWSCAIAYAILCLHVRQGSTCATSSVDGSVKALVVQW